ncbi:beta-ketoacyl synthase N-terminal-like domain-containing protein [Geoalkalibacter halelectricus]|uniref:Beta-ketoacyl synthase-like N-terminal domain-containing protein n=1 Tax=Geoalkalibacter halelectricus TaxID=2847045 RepID=A0ABY5ZPR0_9BACT|nr:beta-ketoacyl synthase N-terminal-like domain-containing protein [Geoalkalibacter halelectricus]MDO3379339.1 hypothetical protein [Geoalkalibacter halelectricus]UWZ81091.1 hypothetical protein L9S41_06765 [Geoalkalibacter halelectricus]
MPMKAATRAQPANKVSAEAPLTIGGLGVCCLAGNTPFALLGAVATHISGAAADERFSLPIPGTEEEAAILTAPVAGLEDFEDPHLRMGTLAQTALAQALATLPEDFAWDELLILTLVPEEQASRGFHPQALEQLKQDLVALGDDLGRAEFRFVSPAEGAVAHLQAACAELREGKWRALLFGGVDSLVDLVSCSLLARQGHLATTASSDGLMPGEGAAYLLIQQDAAAASLAQLVGMGSAAEPHAGDAADKPMTGLAAAVESALAAQSLAPPAMECVVAPHDGSLSGALEWHQTVERLFPRREAAPRAFEELLPCRSLGEVGATALPLSLALGCARFEFAHPRVGYVMVCETGDRPRRGAVLLSLHG